MDEIIKGLLWLVVSIIIVIIMLFLLMLISNDCYNGSKMFEYVDLDGNMAFANDCQYTDKGARSGGMGQPICFVENKIVAVKQYEDKTQYKSCIKALFDGGSND